MHELILASKSPRRKQILTERGYKFRTFPIEVSEILDKNLNFPERISNCARQKAEEAARHFKPLKSEDYLILAADTEVVFNGDTLGKPMNDQHATQILKQLSGQVHHVITGFSLLDLNSKRIIMGHDETLVFFRDLAQSDIAEYVATGDPLDKAGAYGIQGPAQHFIEKYEGSFLNVVGLPIEKIETTMEQNNWQVAKK